ncbi:MAG: hypothetical protein ACRDTC_22775 [Pseudonocardiaceae bacterium]
MPSGPAGVPMPGQALISHDQAVPMLRCSHVSINGTLIQTNLCSRPTWGVDLRGRGNIPGMVATAKL